MLLSFHNTSSAVFSLPGHIYLFQPEECPPSQHGEEGENETHNK